MKQFGGGAAIPRDSFGPLVGEDSPSRGVCNRVQNLDSLYAVMEKQTRFGTAI